MKITRNLIFTIIFLIILIGIFFFKKYNQKIYYTNNGFIQGTTYNIKYESNIDLHKNIDSILHEFDTSLSTYIPTSIISRINQNDTSVEVDDYFANFYKCSKKVSEMTQGAFDITVAPLVNAWGFGFANKSDITDLLIDSLLQITGYKNVKLRGKKIEKKYPEMMLDANAIAQGQSVDVIAEFLNKNGIKNYLVDIGGEVRVQGKNPDNGNWKIGIDKPIENSTEIDRELQAILNISNTSIATSGNYRKFYIKDGIKYSHTIDPKTGRPVHHNLLSATVITNECIYADAYATAFMVMGLENTKKFIEKNNELKVYLIYSDVNGNYQTYMSPELEDFILEIKPKTSLN